MKTEAIQSAVSSTESPPGARPEPAVKANNSTAPVPAELDTVEITNTQTTRGEGESVVPLAAAEKTAPARDGGPRIASGPDSEERDNLAKRLEESIKKAAENSGRSVQFAVSQMDEEGQISFVVKDGTGQVIRKYPPEEIAELVNAPVDVKDPSSGVLVRESA